MRIDLGDTARAVSPARAVEPSRVLNSGPPQHLDQLPGALESLRLKRAQRPERTRRRQPFRLTNLEQVTVLPLTISDIGAARTLLPARLMASCLVVQPVV